MIREEAVIILDGFKNNPLFNDTHVQALDMAISALSVEGDLISRTEVIYAIDEREDVNGNVNAEDVRTDICLIPSKSDKGEWIPVSERLPEEDKEVLIFTKDKEINKAYHTLKEWSDTQWEWFVFGTLGYSLTYSDDEVLAWQPLPEPYEAESEE